MPCRYRRRGIFSLVTFVRPSSVNPGRVGDCAGASGDQDGKRAPLCNAGAVDRVAGLVGAGSTGMTVVDGMTEGVGAIASG